jgi:hypothetical protein
MKNFLTRSNELKEHYYLDSLHEADDEAGEEVEEAPPEEEEVPEGEQMQPEVGAEGEAIPGEEGTMDPGMGGDPAMGGGGFGEMSGEEIKTPSELGRIYELNKIYDRLYLINKFLENNPDHKLIKLRKMVGESFSIFRLVLNNLPSFKDKIDEVILVYYQFISSVVLMLEKYMKKKSSKQKE